MRTYLLPMAVTVAVTTAGFWLLHGMPLNSGLLDTPIAALTLSYQGQQVEVTDQGQQARLQLALAKQGLVLPCAPPPEEQVYTYCFTFSDVSQEEYRFAPAQEDGAGCATFGGRWFSTKDEAMSNILAQWSQDALRSPDRMT